MSQPNVFDNMSESQIDRLIRDIKNAPPLDPDTTDRLPFYEFKCTDGSGNVTNIIRGNAETLQDVINLFEQFVQGSGFSWVESETIQYAAHDNCFAANDEFEDEYERMHSDMESQKSFDFGELEAANYMASMPIDSFNNKTQKHEQEIAEEQSYPDAEVGISNVTPIDSSFTLHPQGPISIQENPYENVTTTVSFTGENIDSNPSVTISKNDSGNEVVGKVVPVDMKQPELKVPVEDIPEWNDKEEKDKVVTPKNPII